MRKNFVLITTNDSEEWYVNINSVLDIDVSKDERGEPSIINITIKSIYSEKVNDIRVLQYSKSTNDLDIGLRIMNECLKEEQ